MRPKRSKLENILSLAQKLMRKGSYAISNHARTRQGQRSLAIGDIKKIIETGYHEKRKDEYKIEFNDWNYSIRGKTLDNEAARVCLAFSDDSHFIVITVIRLEKN